jgi:hypothetical protein
MSGHANGCAAITFEVATSAAGALIAESVVLPPAGSDPVRGPAKWAAEAQRRIQPDQLQRQVSAFMAEFDARQVEVRREAQNEVVDDDGFTLVTKARGKRGVSDGEMHVKTAKSRAKRSRNGTEEAFYGLQKIRARQQAVQQLRAKFLTEKERLKKLKLERKKL